MIFQYESTQPGAPSLSGTAGALIAVLKACLIDGFGTTAVASITVAGGVATATFTGGHSFRPGSPILIAGATPAALNGVSRVSTTATGSVSFPAPAGVADGTASGSITAKVAPAGWAMPFTGTNVAVFRATAPEATECFFRIDDTGTQFGLVRGYVAMTDADTGTGPYPVAAQATLAWTKSNDASSSSREWRIVADERTVLVWIVPYRSDPTVYAGSLFGFGDFLPDRSGDPYASFVAGKEDRNIDSGAQYGDLSVANGQYDYGGMYFPRASTGIGGSQRARKIGAYSSGNIVLSGMSGYASYALPFPNPADNSLRVHEVAVVGGSAGFRGRLPGVFHTPQNAASSFSSGDVVLGEQTFSGRQLLALKCGGVTTAATDSGVVFVDVTGPWR